MPSAEGARKNGVNWQTLSSLKIGSFENSPLDRMDMNSVSYFAACGAHNCWNAEAKQSSLIGRYTIIGISI